MDKSVGHVTLTGRPMVAKGHTELCGDSAGTENLSATANNLSGQLAEAGERLERIIDRITGPSPTCADGCKSPAVQGIASVMNDNVIAAAMLLSRLDYLAGIVGV